jgi:hypothetical protein
MTTRPYSVADRAAGPEENTFSSSHTPPPVAKKNPIEACIVDRESKGCADIYSILRLYYYFKLGKPICNPDEMECGFLYPELHTYM